MPLTVVTLSKVPNSLRGDLTKWMQELAAGVYVGSFNIRIRELLWKRIIDNIGDGEATICYPCKNELGYCFDTMNTQREVVDFDGIPIVQRPACKERLDEKQKVGFSNASKFRKSKIFSSPIKKQEKATTDADSYVVIDAETDGLDKSKDTMIEIGAVKITPSGIEEFQSLIKYEAILPKKIVDLTGITDKVLSEEGRDEKGVLSEFISFIGELPLVGYNLSFDIAFIDKSLKRNNFPTLKNKRYDLLSYIKRKKMLSSYHLQDVLKAYEIDVDTAHRALADAKSTYLLLQKFGIFWKK
jgi:CRISPR-associated endoribonuclease cas2